MSMTEQASEVVQVQRGGTIALPAAFRKELGIDDESHVRIVVVDGELRIRPTQASDTEEGSPGLRALYEYFAPVREEILARGITEAEVNADIDAAIAASRAERRAQRQ